MTAEPRNIQHHIDLGQYHYTQGNFEMMVVSLQRALKIDPENADCNNNIGACLIALQRPAEAEPYLRKVLELDPDSVGAHENLGTCFVLQGRADEAIEEFEEAIRTGNGMPAAYSTLALLYKNKGLMAKARWYVDRFMDQAIEGKYASAEMKVEADDLMQAICGGEELGDKLEFNL